MADTTDKKHAPCLDRLDFLELRALIEKRGRLAAELNLAVERSPEKKALDEANAAIESMAESLTVQYGIDRKAGESISGDTGEIKRAPVKTAAPEDPAPSAPAAPVAVINNVVNSVPLPAASEEPEITVVPASPSAS